MNFFEHQQQARAISKRLIVLFALAVIGTVVLVNVIGAFLYLTFMDEAGRALTGRGGLPTGFYLTNTVVVLLLIGGGTAFEMNRLAAGGEAVASMVGARPVDPSTRDVLERRLLNVVEEMALASGVPVPRVYLMDGENGINAFAAGNNVNDAVIAVTRGTLMRLSRDELQGVVAHEFSHILNGDMALNLRLIGVLFGLLMIAMFGRFLMEMGRGGNSRSGGPILAAGLALWIIGYIGVFFGRLIKAGVSRQREYLADASAVQFTRNPDGIGGALRKIGGLAEGGQPGSRIDHPHAESLSHLFLGAARSSFAAGLFATHPDLADRVRRIYNGRAQEFLPAPELPLSLALAEGAEPARARTALPLPLPGTVFGGNRAEAAAAAFSPLASMVSAGGTSAASGAAVTGAIGQPAARARARAATLRELTADLGLDAAIEGGVRAPLLVLAMLIDKNAQIAAQQRDAVAGALGAEAAGEIARLQEAVRQLPPGLRLAVLDRAMPALRKGGPRAAAKLLELAHVLILADGRTTLPEFLLFTVLERRLGPRAHAPVKVRFQRLADVGGELALVLSLVARMRLPEAPERAFEAGRAVLEGVSISLQPAEALGLDRVGTALARLNELAPLAKPAVIKAAAAAAFVDGSTHWKAASCVRTICIALDAPLPPQIDGEERLDATLAGSPA